MFFPIGYVLPVLFFAIIAFPCALGSMLETKADIFTRKLKLISWQKLTIKEQKAIQLVIIFAQKFGVITWFLMPLNLRSLIEVTFLY